MSEKDIRSKAEIKSEIDKNKAETEKIAAETRKETAEAIKAELEAEFASLELKKRKDDITTDKLLHRDCDRNLSISSYDTKSVQLSLLTVPPSLFRYFFRRLQSSKIKYY